MIKYKSILRWVGSKKRLINHIIEHLPKHFNNYYEPFLGSAIVYLYIPIPNSAYINDYNKDLINIYKKVKFSKEKLVNILNIYYKEYMSCNDKKVYYLQKRAELNKLKNKFTLNRAALYIFINKTCYNGLMQMNKYDLNTSGFGKLHNPKISDYKNIDLLYNKLNLNTTIKNLDYIDFLKNVKKNDFIYLDPPYVPDDIKQCNIKYIKNGWNIQDYDNLVNLCKQLSEKGCYFMLSNSNCDYIRTNFPQNKYNIKILEINRGLCPTSKLRKKETELLIMNY